MRPALVALLVIVAALLGWLGGSASRSDGGLTTIGEMSGLVSVANEDGSKVCLAVAGNDTDRCGAVYRGPDDPPPAIGQRVSVSIGRLQMGDGATEEIFILEPPRENGAP